MPNFVEDFDSNASGARYTPSGLDKMSIADSFLLLQFNPSTQQYENGGDAETQVDLSSGDTGLIVNVTLTPTGLNTPWNFKYSGTSNFAGWNYTEPNKADYPSWNLKTINSVTAFTPDYYIYSEIFSGMSTNVNFIVNQTGDYTSSTLGHKKIGFAGTTGYTTYGSRLVPRVTFTAMEDMSFDSITGNWIAEKYNNNGTSGTLYTASKDTGTKIHGSASYRLSGSWITEGGGTVGANGYIGTRYVSNYSVAGYESPVKQINSIKLFIKNNNLNDVICRIYQGKENGGTLIGTSSVIGGNTAFTDYTINLTPSTGSSSNDFSIRFYGNLTTVTTIDVNIDNLRVRFDNSSNVHNSLVIDFLAGVPVTGAKGIKSIGKLSNNTHIKAGFIEANNTLISSTTSTVNNILEHYPYSRGYVGNIYPIRYGMYCYYYNNIYYGKDNEVTWDLYSIGPYYSWQSGQTNKILEQESPTFANILHEWRGSGQTAFHKPFLSLQTGLQVSEGESNSNIYSSTSSGYLRPAFDLIKTANEYHSYSKGGGQLKYTNRSWSEVITNASKTNKLGVGSIGGFPAYLVMDGSYNLSVVHYGIELPTGTATKNSEVIAVGPTNWCLNGGIVASGSDTSKKSLFMVSSGDINTDHQIHRLYYYNGFNNVTGIVTGFMGYTIPFAWDMVVSGVHSHIAAYLSDNSGGPFYPHYIRVSGNTLERIAQISTVTGTAYSSPLKLNLNGSTPVLVLSENNTIKISDEDLTATSGSISALFASNELIVPFNDTYQSIFHLNRTENRYVNVDYGIHFYMRKFGNPSGLVRFAVTNQTGFSSGSSDDEMYHDFDPSTLTTNYEEVTLFDNVTYLPHTLFHSSTNNLYVKVKVLTPNTGQDNAGIEIRGVSEAVVSPVDSWAYKNDVLTTSGNTSAGIGFGGTSTNYHNHKLHVNNTGAAIDYSTGGYAWEVDFKIGSMLDIAGVKLPVTVNASANKSVTVELWNLASNTKLAEATVNNPAGTELTFDWTGVVIGNQTWTNSDMGDLYGLKCKTASTDGSPAAAITNNLGKPVDKTLTGFNLIETRVKSGGPYNNLIPEIKLKCRGAFNTNPGGINYGPGFAGSGPSVRDFKTAFTSPTGLLSQSFLINTTEYVNDIQLVIKKVGTPSNTYKITLGPSGQAQYTGTFNISSLTTAFQNINWTNVGNITSGSKYITIDYPYATHTNYIVVKAHGSNAYADGAARSGTTVLTDDLDFKVEYSSLKWTPFSTVTGSGNWISMNNNSTSWLIIAQGYSDSNNSWGGSPSVSFMGPLTVVTGTLSPSVTGFDVAINNSTNYPWSSLDVITKGANSFIGYGTYNGPGKTYVYPDGTGFMLGLTQIMVVPSGGSWITDIFQYYSQLKLFKYKNYLGDATMKLEGNTIDLYQTPVTITGNQFSLTMDLLNADIWNPPGIQIFNIEGKSRAEFLVTRNNVNFFRLSDGSGLNSGLFIFDSAKEDGVVGAFDDFTDTNASVDNNKSTLRTKIRFYT